MNCCEAPCTFTGSSEGADMHTARCIGLDIGLKRRCTEENQSVCCVVHGRQSCPDAFYFSPCRLLLEWSQLLFYARLCATWKVSSAQGVRIRVQAKNITIISVIASFADGRAHATCNLLGMCGHLSSLFGMKQTRKSPDRASWLA